jgi:hypothetical protein
VKLLISTMVVGLFFSSSPRHKQQTEPSPSRTTITTRQVRIKSGVGTSQHYLSPTSLHFVLVMTFVAPTTRTTQTGNNNGHGSDPVRLRQGMDEENVRRTSREESSIVILPNLSLHTVQVPTIHPFSVISGRPIKSISAPQVRLTTKKI